MSVELECDAVRFEVLAALWLKI